MTVERTEKDEFCSVNKTQLKSLSSSAVDEEFSLKSDTSVVKATTRPRSAIRNLIVALSRSKRLS